MRSHIFFDGKMYNDRPPALVYSNGADKNSIMPLRDRIATRGVLLDMREGRAGDI